MRSPRPWCFSHPATAATSRERNCLWMAVSHKCRPLIAEGTASTIVPPLRTSLCHQRSREWGRLCARRGEMFLTLDAKRRGSKQEMSCLSWNWRERSFVKITERTHAKRAEALHCRREGWHPKTAFAG